MTQVSTAVGLILGAHGTMRLFRNDHGRFYVEVVGFTSEKGREFLSDLGGQLEDITCEILFHDEYEELGELPFSPARLHRRRPA